MMLTVAVAVAVAFGLYKDSEDESLVDIDIFERLMSKNKILCLVLAPRSDSWRKSSLCSS